MIAALPMYDFPEIRHETDSLWTGIRDHLRDSGIAAPETLSRSADPEAEWSGDTLLMSQTCGRPYATSLAGRVLLVGIPAHAETGTRPGRYCSVLVARKSDPLSSLAELADRRMAINALNSQSGYAAPVRMLIAEGFVSRPEPQITGAHRESIRAVADGRADWASIDLVTWLLALRHEPATRDLEVFARTPETPALPVITGPDNAAHIADIAAAWRSAIAGLSARDRKALLVSGFEDARPEDYLPLAAPFDPRLALPGLPG
ncbi:phosphate/phosphite/phosphonate ABC transporter substrate-binding protein [Hoeflea sp.]|uniref:phosphate/phosphite/phosphonate ABC transporter substrate-binding protein n=1 Tax=Hoeflea sp. TaxID=1940281 RepID=UPI003B5274FB